MNSEDYKDLIKLSNEELLSIMRHESHRIEKAAYNNLVEKNKECKSEVYRLDELKGVRRDDNIYAKYMAGAYGAVPNI